MLGWTVLESPLLHISYSPLGVVPKRTPGEFCLIHHLSYLKGLSVNDGISSDNIRHIRIAGRGYFLAKTDGKKCFLDCSLLSPRL